MWTNRRYIAYLKVIIIYYIHTYTPHVCKYVLLCTALMQRILCEKYVELSCMHEIQTLQIYVFVIAFHYNSKLNSIECNEKWQKTLTTSILMYPVSHSRMHIKSNECQVTQKSVWYVNLIVSFEFGVYEILLYIHGHFEFTSFDDFFSFQYVVCTMYEEHVEFGSLLIASKRKINVYIWYTG